MTLPSADESLLRRYLLGTVTDAARKDLEARLFSDDRIFWERISIAEDELVSDYVQNALSQEERQDFEKHFLCTDERRSKVEFASALHSHARTTRSATQEPRESRWAWLLRPMLSPAWAAAAAALLLIVVQVSRIQPRGPDNALDVVAMTVPSGQTRAAGGDLTRVRLTPNSRIVQLQLDPESARFAGYRASVHQVDDDALLADMKLTPESTAGSSNLTLTLPAALLAGGDYYVRLHGVSPGAPPVPLQRYDFRVIRD
jgi:hypothetical protein